MKRWVKTGEKTRHEQYKPSANARPRESGESRSYHWLKLQIAKAFAGSLCHGKPCHLSRCGSCLPLAICSVLINLLVPI